VKDTDVAMDKLGDLILVCSSLFYLVKYVLKVKEEIGTIVSGGGKTC
jgi:hypothetical protein